MNLLDYDATINYSIQQTYTLNSHFTIDASVYISSTNIVTDITGIIYEVQTATRQIVLYRNDILSKLSIRISDKSNGIYLYRSGDLPILGAGGISSAITSGIPSDNEVLITVPSNSSFWTTNTLFNNTQGDQMSEAPGGDNSVNSGGVGTNGGEAWFQMEFSLPKYVTSYKMWPRAGGDPPAGGSAAHQAKYMPKDFAIYGTNDGVSWTLLDQQTNQTHPGTDISTVLGSGIYAGGSGNSSRTWSVSEAEDQGYSSWGSPNYVISTPGSYKIYKFSVTAVTFDNSKMQLSEFALYGREDSRNNIYDYNVENLNNKWLHLVSAFSPDYIPRLWINNTEIIANAAIIQHNDTTINDDDEDLVALKFGLCDAKYCAFTYDATGFIFDGSGSAIEIGSEFDVISANILGNNSRTIIATINVNNITANGYVWSYGNFGNAYQLFGLKLTSVSGTYRLDITVWDYDWITDVYIQEQVETTIAVSYDGPSKTAYLFIKNTTTGLWEIKSHTFSSEINTTLGAAEFTIGALVTNTSGHYLEFFKGEIGKVIIYNHSVANANFYGENAKPLDAPSYNSMPWYWAESFSSGFSRIRNVNILNGYSADSDRVKQLYENSIRPAYVVLYRDSLSAEAIEFDDGHIFIDLQYMNAYDKDDNLIVPVGYSSFGTDTSSGNYPMSNALEGTTIGGSGFWSVSHNPFFDGSAGGWIKYPEMPYRIAIGVRTDSWGAPAGATRRKPAFLKTSYVEVIGTNYTNWEKKYEFIDITRFGTNNFGNIGEYQLNGNLYQTQEWGYDAGDGNVIIKSYDGVNTRFVKISQIGVLVTGLGGNVADTGKYILSTSVTYATLADLIAGYNGATHSQATQTFVKRIGFDSILFNNPSSYDIILEGFGFSNKALLQTAVDAWCSDRLSAENIYGHISDWNTHDIIDMSSLFDGKNTFNDDISGWDVSNVTTMYGMFGGCTIFNQPLNSWDVSNVESFRWMFYNCSDFN